VVPGRADLTVDYRQVPGDAPEAVIARLASLDPEAVVRVPEEVARSEDGAVERRFPRVNGAYLLDPAHPAIAWAGGVLAGTRGGRPVDVGTWWFATDAPYLATLGAPILGLGPGDPEVAHTTREALPIDELVAAVDDYQALAAAFLRGRVPWEDAMTPTRDRSAR
jgi:acetylornithine deacetylase/succinyl-diaminopimelate desuccinylase-like protein